jgi:DNA-binding CsgD family transcriptional regulator
MRFDVIGAVEACYARAGDDQAWLSGLLETVSPLARGHAIYALTRNERSVLAFAAMGHQNKYIAYLLGFSPSAVTSHLRSAQRKLGLSSRGDLIRTFARVVLAAPDLASTSSTHDRPYA